jgi:hypothetical protein
MTVGSVDGAAWRKISIALIDLGLSAQKLNQAVNDNLGLEET